MLSAVSVHAGVPSEDLRNIPSGAGAPEQYVMETVAAAPAGIAGLMRTGSTIPWHDAIPSEMQASNFAARLLPAFKGCLSQCK